jgi:hypothetical protein
MVIFSDINMIAGRPHVNTQSGPVRVTGGRTKILRDRRTSVLFGSPRRVYLGHASA